MRYPVKRVARLCILILSATLAACSGGNSDTGLSNLPPAISGPAADYPIVVGDPYRIDGVLYEPTDTLNYDEVGRIASDPTGGTGVTAAHQTLPLPSYIEVTSLDTGKTILVRIERRGPMTTNRIAALSADALAQIEVADGAPVRIRRVNPPEVDRAALRQGNKASERMDTPMSLVGVLRRELGAPGSAPTPPQRVAVDPSNAAAAPAEKDSVPILEPFSPTQSTGTPVSAEAQPVKSVSRVETTNETGIVVQVAAFSTDARAQRAASALGGFVQRSGNYFRVRTGPFESRGEAEASLAKVRAAGYSDARIVNAD